MVVLVLEIVLIPQLRQLTGAGTAAPGPDIIPGTAYDTVQHDALMLYKYTCTMQ